MSLPSPYIYIYIYNSLIYLHRKTSWILLYKQNALPNSMNGVLPRQTGYKFCLRYLNFKTFKIVSLVWLFGDYESDTWPFVLSLFNLIFVLFWSVADWQCCVSLRYTAKWFSHAYTHAHYFSDFFSHIG